MDSKRITVSEGILLAIVPALGYGYAYAYEYGRTRRFNLPYWMIEISLGNVILSCALLLFSVMVVSHIFRVLPKGPWGGLFYHFLGLVPLIIMSWWTVYVAYLVYKAPSSNWVDICISILIAILVTIFLLLDFFRRIVNPLFASEGSWLERWDAIRKKDAEQALNRGDLESDIIRRLDNTGWNASRYMFPLWVILIAIPYLYYFTGLWISKIKNDFFVIDTNPACIVVHRYKDALVCAEIEGNPVQLSGRIRLIFDNIENITLRPEIIDNLK